tara:strand:- start:2116 stop:2712 length:597 start_codon:yes stop_codon:yes gene_type:complete
MKDTNFDFKIKDLKFHIDGLVPKNICNSFINFFEKHKDKTLKESSYKYNEKKNVQDNFTCLNLTELCAVDNNFTDPLNIAKKYLFIMIKNYTIYLQNNVSSNFDDKLISNSSNIRILKYDVGQHIKDHSDVDGTIRASCTLNLNEDYEGGEFRFFNGRIKESFKTGDAMIFPAEPIWIHGTEPITKGARYSINCFLHA